jgi:hypothetical protein
MRQITNREEANQFYEKINSLIDIYIDKYKIRPNEVYKYINKNKESFLEDSGLSDVYGIDKVLNDVIEHRKNMEIDKVLKFENFSYINESVLEINISSVEHEKVLADYYNTSLGNIECSDENLHLYSINDFSDKFSAIIYSNSEIESINKNILDSLTKEVESKVLNISKIDGVDIGVDMRLWISEFIDKEKLLSILKDKISKENVIKIISNLIKDKKSTKNLNTDKIKYIDKFDGYHIWEI